MQAAGWCIRAAKAAVALVGLAMPLAACEATAPPKQSLNSSEQADHGRYYGQSLIPKISNDSIFAGVRNTIATYPPTRCAANSPAGGINLPAPWTMEGCGPDTLVIIAKLESLGFITGNKPDLLDHYVLVEALYDPVSIRDVYHRRLRMFNAEFDPGEEQGYIANLLGTDHLGSFKAAGNPQPHSSRPLFGRAYLFDSSKKTVCEITGPAHEIFVCSILQADRALQATFLRKLVGRDFIKLLDRISSDLSGKPGE